MKTMILAFAAVAALTANAANAAPQTAPTVSVSYADLDLHSAAGMKTLHSRIRSAAMSVCINPDSSGLIAQAAVRNCRTAAVAGAMKQLPSFTAQEVASR